MSTDFDVKNRISSDIRDDLPEEKRKNYLAIQRRSHEFWIKIIVTAIALVLIIASFCFLVHFSLASKFRPHTIYDIPVILTLSVLPITILVLLINYFYKNENNKKTNECVIIPQTEIVKTLLSAIKNLCNQK